MSEGVGNHRLNIAQERIQEAWQKLSSVQNSITAAVEEMNQAAITSGDDPEIQKLLSAMTRSDVICEAILRGGTDPAGAGEYLDTYYLKKNGSSKVADGNQKGDGELSSFDKSLEESNNYYANAMEIISSASNEASNALIELKEAVQFLDQERVPQK